VVFRKYLGEICEIEKSDVLHCCREFDARQYCPRPFFFICHSFGDRVKKSGQIWVPEWFFANISGKYAIKRKVMFYIVVENLMHYNIVLDNFSLSAIVLEIGSKKWSNLGV
jgi:hypothetical protein